MTPDIDNAVWAWAKRCPCFADEPLFNFLGADDGSWSIFPIASPVRELMSGVRDSRYEFAIRAAFIVSDAYGDPRNTNCMRTLRNWLNWVREQERRGHYPDLGRRRGGYELRNIDDDPQMALINGNTAIFSCRSVLLYLEG